MFLIPDFKFATGVPFSSSFNFEPPSLDASIPTFNEGDSVAVASGTWLGGQNTLVYLQSSGIGNLLNPLTSWVLPARIPICMLVSPRGGPEDTEPHRLDPIQVDFLIKLPGLNSLSLTGKDFGELNGIWAKSIETRDCLAVLLKGEPPSRVSDGLSKPFRTKETSLFENRDWIQMRNGYRDRFTFLEELLPYFDANDIKIATTGFTSRELFALGDSPSNLYCQGAMGCASLIGLGISKTSKKRVLVLDGEGALLMRPSALASIGLCSDPDLWHFVLDNSSYASTGGQQTHSTEFDLCRAALGFGYQVAVETTCYDSSLDKYLNSFQGPKFIRVFVHSSHKPKSRVPLSLSSNTWRLREFIKSLSHF
ncbi:hypothetical protein EBT16_02720 [bacterium]|nr:hypothetical protein [bacterium]